MTSSDQTEFLLTIRRSLGHQGPTPPVDMESLLGRARDGDESADLKAKLESRSRELKDSLLDTLEEEVSSVGGNVTRIGSVKRREEYLDALVSQRGLKSVVRWDTPMLSELDSALLKSGAVVTPIISTSDETQPQVDIRDKLVSADLGITEADYAIADTGSLVLMADQRRSRLVSLLPPVHVALLKPDVIVPSMADLLPVLAASQREDHNNLSNCITFITGPSRTADIEKIITIGVHGPEELHLLILEYP